MTQPMGPRVFICIEGGGAGRSAARKKLGAREADGDLSKQITVNSMTSYKGMKRGCCEHYLCLVEITRNKQIYFTAIFY